MRNAQEEREKLDKRIHNQRARLRQMEKFHWGECHLHTIRQYCRIYRENQRLRAELAIERGDHLTAEGV